MSVQRMVVWDVNGDPVHIVSGPAVVEDLETRLREVTWNRDEAEEERDALRMLLGALACARGSRQWEWLHGLWGPGLPPASRHPLGYRSHEPAAVRPQDIRSYRALYARLENAGYEVARIEYRDNDGNPVPLLVLREHGRRL